MTTHMIQSADQDDDIIQEEYNMSQFPTPLHKLLWRVLAQMLNVFSKAK